MTNYNQPTNIDNHKKAYLKQAIEVDSIAFAFHYIKDLFDIELKLTGEVMEHIK